MIGVLSWNARKLEGMRGALWGLAVLLCASCGGVPKTYYYTLQSPAPPPRSDPKTSFVLGVEHFHATGMLRDDRIIYFASPNQMAYYEYHRWGSDPATMLSEVASRYIANTGLFAEVRMLPTRGSTDYILGGRVLNFEEVDFEAGGRARVGLELRLVRSRDGKVVWSDTRRAEAPIQEKGMDGVVNALDASAQQLLREMVPGLAAQVEQDFKASQGQSPN